MSIFDRLISTLTGADTPAEAVHAPRGTPTKQTDEEDSGRQRSRFMGREGETSAGSEVVVEQGLVPGSVIWLHIQPTSQRLLLVPDLGIALGTELNATQSADLLRAGWCEEVAYHAGYDQYWKMPSQEAILRTPSLYQIPTPLLNRVKLETRLVKQGEPRGFWMRVRIRQPEELPVNEEPQTQV